MDEELNVQKLVERETNQLKDRIEDLQTRMEKLRKDLRKKKENENELKSEIETLKKVLFSWFRGLLLWHFIVTLITAFKVILLNFWVINECIKIIRFQFIFHFFH